MSKDIKIVTERPLSTQEAWDQHCEERSPAPKPDPKRSKTGFVVSAVIVCVVIGLFVLAALPLTHS